MVAAERRIDATKPYASRTAKRAGPHQPEESSMACEPHERLLASTRKRAIASRTTKTLSPAMSVNFN
jgi:hypothetical protein